MTVEVGCALSHLDLPIVEAAEVHTYTVFTQVPYYFDFHLYSDLLLFLFFFNEDFVYSSKASCR